MRTANERRLEMIKTISAVRFITIGSLARRFDVSERTVRRDIEILSLDYPIEAVRGNGGGVRAVDGWRFSKQYLSERQEDLLRRMRTGLQAGDQKILDSILASFAKPQIRKEG